MQIFANGKRRFDSFVDFYVIHQKYQGVEIWSTRVGDISPANEAEDQNTTSASRTKLLENGPPGDSHMKQTGMLVGNFEFNP